MIDVAAVPNRLENSISEAERQNILYSFFPQIMIDTINLVLANAAQQLLVKGLGRFQIVAKRLLYDHSPPVLATGFIH